MMTDFFRQRGYKVTFAVLSIFFFFVLIPSAWGAQYTPLVGIPELGTAQNTGLAGYLNRIYVILIAVGAIIAFIKISIAGVKWSLSDIVTDKSSAKADIKGALLGLAILLIPFIVLNTIYPGLTNLNILQNAGDARVNLNTSSGPGGTTFSDGSPVSTNPDDIARPQDVRVGEVVGTCTYRQIGEPVVIPGQTGPSGEPVYTDPVYDTTRCLSQSGLDCVTELYGTVTETSVSGGTCRYLEATIPTCSPGADC